MSMDRKRKSCRKRRNLRDILSAYKKEGVGGTALLPVLLLILAFLFHLLVLPGLI